MGSRSTRPVKASSHAIRNGYRSGLELDNSKRLDAWADSLGFTYGYESEKIKYTKPATSHKYTPDFIIKTKTGRVIYVETKGRFLADDRKKHLLIKKQHPELDIRFVFQRAKSPIRKGSKTTLAMWADKNGFKWSEKMIPLEWLQE